MGLRALLDGSAAGRRARGSVRACQCWLASMMHACSISGWDLVVEPVEVFQSQSILSANEVLEIQLGGSTSLEVWATTVWAPTMGESGGEWVSVCVCVCRSVSLFFVHAKRCCYLSALELETP